MMQTMEKSAALAQIHNECDISRPYCFVSYSSRDSSSVHSIVSSLRETGYNAWIDLELEKHIGDEWDRVVEQVILNENCKCILWFVSSNSCKSVAAISEPCFSFGRTKFILFSQSSHGIRRGS